jgi:hypothetical protein
VARSPSSAHTWRRRFAEAASGPLDETRAWTLLGINLAVLPGLGSILAGRRLAGIAQAIVSSAGAILSTWWLLLLLRQWADEGYFPADGGNDLRIGVAGVVLFGISWLWSLVTSLSVLRSITSANRSHRDTETQRTD